MSPKFHFSCNINPSKGIVADYDIYQWCRQHNWTEPRQLDNGDWVAFPPGGVIETPLPINSSPTLEPIINSSQDLINALIVVITALAVGAIAIIISPLFVEKRIRQHKQKQSQL
ncbi:MAG: hypothetical protein AAF383_13330 [Cyanobacteria bacterium P01_A01_bin.83]